MRQSDDALHERVRKLISRINNPYVNALAIAGALYQGFVTTFGIETEKILTPISEFLLSELGSRIFLIAILYGIYRIYCRIEIQNRELEYMVNEKISNINEPNQIETDGGQPRDSKGRFTTERGGNSSLPIILGGLSGYLLVTDTGIDPITGAIVGAIIGALLSSY